MPPRPCIVCGKPTRNGSRCEQHPTAWTRRSPSASRGYGGDWPRIAKRVIDEHVALHGWTCPGDEHHAPHPSHDLTVDHIVPLREGGTNDRGNLRVLCRGANTSRAVRASNERRRGQRVRSRS